MSRSNQLSDVWQWILRLEDDKCWPWRGHGISGGYGQYRWRGRRWMAHVVAYMAYYGEAPSGVVMHKCNNKQCCNPHHLVVGTNQLNQVHHSLSTARHHTTSNTGIRGVSYNSTRGVYQASAGPRTLLYRGSSIFAAWLARLRWEASAADVLHQLNIAI